MKKHWWHILAHESQSYDITRKDVFRYRGKIYQILSCDFQKDSLEQCKKVRDEYCKNVSLRNPVILRIVSDNCYKLIKGEFSVVHWIYKRITRKVKKLLETSSINS